MTGADWWVHFNLPDQSTSFGTATPEEFALRDVMVARLQALDTNQTATLATYTFSGSNVTAGAAGPLLNAMEAALNRGARLRMVVDGEVTTATPNGGSNSLAGLAARSVNPLQLASGPTNGIMHHKLGLFDYSPADRRVLLGSWNFTAGACSLQWNIMLEVRNQALFAAYTNETAELLAGRFFSNTNKSHAHDRSAFTVAGAWQPGWVRFAPYTNSSVSGGNALTDITNLIQQAESHIVFALNSLTRMQVATQLVQACDRGVRVEGVFPLGEINPPSSLNTFPVYAYLTNAANYATTNRALIRTAWAKADFATADSGQSDLVHAKWMVLDPFGARPVVICGSANWTQAALQDTNSNDENLAFLFHAEIARAFYLHYRWLTAPHLIMPWPDVWLTRGDAAWLTLTSTPILAWSPTVTGTWSTTHSFTNGWAAEQRDPAQPVGFYRLLPP